MPGPHMVIRSLFFFLRVLEGEKKRKKMSHLDRIITALGYFTIARQVRLFRTLPLYCEARLLYKGMLKSDFCIDNISGRLVVSNINNGRELLTQVQSATDLRRMKESVACTVAGAPREVIVIGCEIMISVSLRRLVIDNADIALTASSVPDRRVESALDNGALYAFLPADAASHAPATRCRFVIAETLKCNKHFLLKILHFYDCLQFQRR